MLKEPSDALSSNLVSHSPTASYVGMNSTTSAHLERNPLMFHVATCLRLESSRFCEGIALVCFGRFGRFYPGLESERRSSIVPGESCDGKFVAVRISVIPD